MDNNQPFSLENAEFLAAQDDKQQFRTTPENGHTLLLMEFNREERVFKDYPNLLRCVDAIVSYYEEYRVSNRLERDGYTIQELWKWLDSLHRIDMFSYDREIGRYKRSSRSDLKEAFIGQIQKLM